MRSGSVSGAAAKNYCGNGVIAVFSGNLRRVVSYAALAAVAGTAGSAGALAECQRPQFFASVFDLIPLASGTAVSSIISTISTINTSSLAQTSAFSATPANPGPNQQGGGNWSRVIAGTTEAENTSVTTGSVPGLLAPTTVDCRSTTKHDFVGSQAGMDIGRYNFAGGGNLTYGVTAGYFDIKSKDRTPGIGTFGAESQVPFAGVYLGISSGNFSFDAQVRGDTYSMELSDVDQGMFKQPLTARGVAFLWNASYRFNLPNQWFIEPSIGGVSSRTEVDRLEVAGGINVPGSLSPSSTLPGSVQIDDINSLLGRASIRAGTTIVSGPMAWQPFATASVFHEFAGNVRTNMTTLDLGLPIEGTSSTSREGTVGHLGLGIAGVVLNTGWLGYVRGDYRFGDSVESVSVNAGLRYQFQPEQKPVGLKDGGGGEEHHDRFNWTGLYAGWSSGSLWGREDWTYPNGETTSPKHQGYMIGGQVGYNYQIGHAVLGLEADYSLSNAEGGTRCPNASFFSCIGAVNGLGFATGRLGYAHERALYYFKGGLAFGEVEARAKFNLDGGSLIVPGEDVLRDTKSMTGWAFGAGMEYAVNDRWSVKGEWMRYDLGSDVFRTGTGAGSTPKVDTTGDIARVGVNYHFGHREEHHESMK